MAVHAAVAVAAVAVAGGRLMAIGTSSRTSVRTSTMRSARISAAGEVGVEEVPIPAPGRGEIRLAIEGCGVCGSDLPVWEGRSWFEYPREPGEPGHEAWGHVDALGPGVTGLTVGERVATLGYRSYAEYDIAAAASAVTLPAVLGDRPFPGEPLGCAANVFERARIEPGDTVAVLGTGFLGALVVGFAAAHGARVIAISRRETSRTAAAGMGAEFRLPMDESTLDRVNELTGGELCDVVVEATGGQAALDLCGPLTRVRGRIVIAGFHQDGRRSVDLQLWNWRGLDVINAHERDPGRYVDGMHRAVAAVAGGEVTPDTLYTHHFGLEHLGEAFAMLRDRPPGFVKAMVIP